MRKILKIKLLRLNRSILIFCILSLLNLGKIYSQEGAKPTQKPNIILIYTDQQRYNTIAALGNDRIITPNLDRLVKEGTAFTHAFVSSPVCMPSRSSLFSGMYTTSHQTYSNHHVGKRPETSLPLELKKVGYKTVLIGKNHSFLEKQKDLDIEQRVAAYKNDLKDLRSAEHAMDWDIAEDPEHRVTDRALEVLDESNKQGGPLFMCLSYIHPHTPYHCPEPYYSMYDNVAIDPPVVEKKGLKKANKPFRQQFHQLNNNLIIPYDEKETMRMKRTYYGMVTMIDQEIGRLLAFLDEHHMRENTLIIFTSDHGDYMGDHGMYTKSPAMYDCLVRVPFIFSYPGVVKEGQVSSELVSCIDIMPTVLDMLDMSIPNQVQGLSLEKCLKGEENQQEREFVFAEYGIPGKPILEKELEERMPDYKENPIKYSSNLPWEANPVALAGRFRMIRSQDYKLVEEIGGTNELYDLKKDPNELKNLYGKKRYSSVQQQLQQQLNTWKSQLPGIELDTIPMGEENFSTYLKKRNKIN